MPSDKPIEVIATPSRAPDATKPPPPSTLKRVLTLSFCAFLSICLHLLFHLALTATSTIQLDIIPTIAISGAISFLWIKLYTYITGETSINPFVNICLTLGSPFVAAWLRDDALREGLWAGDVKSIGNGKSL